MHKLLSFILLAATSLGALAVDVIPRPAYVSEQEGSFTLNAQTQSKVKFVLDKKVKGAEAYTLVVTPKGITAKASTQAGLFYAQQTLNQLVREDGTVPCVVIKDAPRFAYRGLMIDPCRHFETVATVKKEIDMMAKYKFNVMHWHLTDDQGWRVEIKKYPELLTKGAVRVEGDGSIHKGYYTQEEIKEVVAYAAERHITVVPELEMPGHELAAIAAYPHLSCRGEQTTPRIVWGVEDIVMCPGKEDMFTFLQDVIDEMVPLFPGELFHIGGDESPRGEWEKCPKCQARMKAEGLTKEAELQSYIIARMEKYLNQKGKTIIGWDEILEGGNLNKSAIVMSWRGEEGGITAAKAGHKVLMTPSSRGCYFDTYQGEPMVEQSECIWGPCTLKQVYEYDPIPENLKDIAPYVMGVQANVWHEYIHNEYEFEERIWPRAFALAEIAWSPVEGKDFADFQRRVETAALPRLDKAGYHYHIPVPQTVGGSCDFLTFLDSRDLALETTRPERIVYTLDGTEPTVESATYTGPLHFTRSAVVKTACILPSGVVGPVRTIQLKKVAAYQPSVDDGKLTRNRQGLTANIYWGNFYNTHSIQAACPDSVCDVPTTRELSRLINVPNSIRNVRNYATIADGKMWIEADGVYEFKSQNIEVYIDGKKVIDNGASLLQRHSRYNAEVALAKGVHDIRIVFIGGIFEGWPTYWDDASVNFRSQGSNEWKPIQVL